MKKAFTLAEITIAISVFGIIAGLVITNSKLIINKTSNSKLSNTAYNVLRNSVADYVSEKGLIKSSSDLCTRIANVANIAGDIKCSLPTTSNFSKENANLILSNGMRLYNFGSELVNSDAQELLDELIDAENIMETEEDTSEEYLAAKTVREENLKALADLAPVYIIYVDIDGKNRKGVLNDDVIMFSVNMFGEVLPYGEAANNLKYFAASYKYLKPDTKAWTWAEKNITFKDAICKTGTKLQTKNYCNAEDISGICKKYQCKYILLN